MQPCTKQKGQQKCKVWYDISNQVKVIKWIQNNVLFSTLVIIRKLNRAQVFIQEVSFGDGEGSKYKNIINTNSVWYLKWIEMDRYNDLFRH